MNLISFRCAVLAGMVAGIGGMRVNAQTESNRQSLNDGYSQFYHFCDQEKDLSLLTYIKTTAPEIADYQREISSTARDDMAILTKFAAEDKGVRLNKVSLSGFEQDVRTSMDEDRNRELLLNTSGAAYGKAVLMTQSEATNYGLHVAKVLSQREPNPDRAKAMNRIFMRWSRLHAEAYKLNQ
jgi:hypothetical protein